MGELYCLLTIAFTYFPEGVAANLLSSTGGGGGGLCGVASGTGWFRRVGGASVGKGGGTSFGRGGEAVVGMGGGTSVGTWV